MLVALGIDGEGKKHVLGVREGATENAAACTALLADLRDRGLHSDRPVLIVIDGAKALAKAVRNVFGERAIVQRCQAHKTRNVVDQLTREGSVVTASVADMVQAILVAIALLVIGSESAGWSFLVGSRVSSRCPIFGQYRRQPGVRCDCAVSSSAGSMCSTIADEGHGRDAEHAPTEQACRSCSIALLCFGAE